MRLSSSHPPICSYWQIVLLHAGDSAWSAYVSHRVLNCYEIKVLKKFGGLFKEGRKRYSFGKCLKSQSGWDFVLNNLLSSANFFFLLLSLVS